MKLLNAAKATGRILLARLTERKIPVAVRFKVTNRCTLRCQYCTIWNDRVTELTTSQILRAIREMGAAGVQHLSLSGGDPMIRSDIDLIIATAVRAGISVSMNSPGFLIAQKISALKNLDLLKLSLDGPPDIHDRLRKKGSYAEVINAAKTAQAAGVKIAFATTLTKHNIQHLDHLLGVAKSFNTVVAFQPLKELYKGMSDLSHVAPELQDYRTAVDLLITEKRKGNSSIRNSLEGLRYIRKWPELEPLHCGAGWIFCVVEGNGDVLSCDRVRAVGPHPNLVKQGFASAFASLQPPDCRGCGFCGSLELNYLLSFRWGIVSSITRIL